MTTDSPTGNERTSLPTLVYSWARLIPWLTSGSGIRASRIPPGRNTATSGTNTSRGEPSRLQLEAIRANIGEEPACHTESPLAIVQESDIKSIDLSNEAQAYSQCVPGSPAPWGSKRYARAVKRALVQPTRNLTPLGPDLRQLVLSPRPLPLEQDPNYYRIAQMLAKSDGDLNDPSLPNFGQPSEIREKQSLTLVECFIGSQNHSRRIAPLAVLIVAIGDEDLTGPEHDSRWFIRTFPTVVFYVLKGQLATAKGIQSALNHVFKNTKSFRAVALYFAGHSNKNNAFLLYDKRPIYENTVLAWVARFRPAVDEPFPVLLAFDSCRNNDVPVMPTLKLKNVSITRGCRCLQYVYETPLDDDLPESNLLKIFCLVLYEMESPHNVHKTFMETVAAQALRITKITRAFICEHHEYTVRWNKCTCAECIEGRLCLHVEHRQDPAHKDLIREDLVQVLQDPVGYFSGYGDDIKMNTVLAPVESILDYVREPVERIAGQIEKWYQNWVSQPLQEPSGSAHSVRRGVRIPAATATAPSLPESFNP